MTGNDPGSSQGCVLWENWPSWLLDLLFLNKRIYGFIWLMQSGLWFGRLFFFFVYLFLFQLVVIDVVEMGLFFGGRCHFEFPFPSRQKQCHPPCSVVSVNTCLQGQEMILSCRQLQQFLFLMLNTMFISIIHVPSGKSSFISH